MWSKFKNYILAHSPRWLYCIIVNNYYLLHPGKKTRMFVPVKDGCWHVWTTSESYYTIRGGGINRGSSKKQSQKFNRYTSKKVTVEPGDLVVDIGAFLGEFSIPAAEIAKQVIAVEPDPRSYRCLEKQIKEIENIVAVQALPAGKKETVHFKIGANPTESSIINVDQGSYQTISLQSQTLEGILKEMQISHVDFLKVDAEGAEPEVLQGLGDIEVQKYAIDAGKERHGSSTIKEVKKVLESRGCKTNVEGAMVYGIGK